MQTNVQMTVGTGVRAGLAALGMLGILATVALPLTAAGPQQLELEGTSWNFVAGEQRDVIKLKGFAKQLNEGQSDLALDLVADTFLLESFDGPLTGTTQGKGSRRKLLPGPAGEQQLSDVWLARVEAAALQAGLSDVELELTSIKTRLRLRVKSNKAEGMATGRLRGSLRLKGRLLAQLGGPSPVELGWKVKVSLRAESGPLPLADLVVGGPPPSPPVANFVMGASSGTAPLTVHFASTSTGSIDSWEWDFGDGPCGTCGLQPVHVFEQPGLSPVTLTVSGPLGSDSRTRMVLVEAVDKPLEPWMTLFPALTGASASNPKLLSALTPASNFTVGMTSGFSWEFKRILAGTPAPTHRYGLTLSMSSQTPRTVQAVVEVQTSTGPQVLLGPVEFSVPGSGVSQTFHVEVTDGPVMQAAAGNVLKLSLTNVSPDDPLGPFAQDLLIRLDQSSIQVPIFP